jgi:hypothetical protein
MINVIRVIMYINGQTSHVKFVRVIISMFLKEFGPLSTFLQILFSLFFGVDNMEKYKNKINGVAFVKHVTNIVITKDDDGGPFS